MQQFKPHCHIKGCPCERSPEAVLCKRHLSMVTEQERKELTFFTKNGDTASYWAMWRILIAHIKAEDAEFLSKFNRTKSAYPTPLTGVSRCTPTQKNLFANA